jgi:hypothetical protein
MTTTTATFRPWAPTERDRMIYRWVKFDGHKQSWVAEQLEMHQSTVSRIIDRYERWIAHGGPAQQGALARDERIRAQRWLTYERNEWILTSCLRLAGEMERMSDTSKSTTKHYCSEPSREIEVRTENSIRDRTGVAARYLRLAHRINMEQKKLVEQDDLPALEPLLLDEHEYSEALADIQPKYVTVAPDEHQPVPTYADYAAGPGSPDPARNKSQIPTPQSEIDTPPPPFSPSPTPDLPRPMPALHNPEPFASQLTPDATITSLQIAPHKKPILHAYASPQIPPEPTESLASVLDATIHQPLPPIRILPLMTPLP